MFKDKPIFQSWSFRKIWDYLWSLSDQTSIQMLKMFHRALINLESWLTLIQYLHRMCSSINFLPLSRTQRWSFLTPLNKLQQKNTSVLWILTCKQLYLHPYSRMSIETRRLRQQPLKKAMPFSLQKLRRALTLTLMKRTRIIKSLSKGHLTDASIFLNSSWRMPMLRRLSQSSGATLKKSWSRESSSTLVLSQTSSFPRFSKLF